MFYLDYKSIAQAEGPNLPDPSLTIGSVEGVCTVDGLYPLPIICASSSFSNGTVIDVQDEQNHALGMILMCKDEEYELQKFGAAYLSAYLFEVAPDQFAQVGKFSRNYFLVRTERIKEYRARFMESSAVWGGFWHSDLETLHHSEAAQAPQPIVAWSGIVMPTSLHKAAAQRSAMLPFAFERYLKLYHLLELSFDHDTVERIKKLGDDLHGIGQILSQHKRDEFDRLKQLVIEKCSDRGVIAKCIEEICKERKWDPTTRAIFFAFGKDGNPFSDKQNQFEQMIRGPGFSLQGAKKSGILSGKEPKQEAFEILCLKTAAYWIYRVRCSIAHNRIGEYVMKPQDEEFVEQFAEKLLRQVLGTVLR